MEGTKVRAFSSPDLAPMQTREDYSLGGIATNVKLLLKLIQEHLASTKDHDNRTTQRVAGMLAILDDIKTRLQKSQSGKKRFAELRRCNTDLRPNQNQVPTPRKPQETVTDEKDKLRRQLTACMAARKSLEVMCSSLGKEKEIMAAELAKKVHELNEMEQLVNDLRVQNEKMMNRLKSCAQEHKDKKCCGTGGGDTALQERNKALSEQLLKSLDSYRSLKRKYRGVKEENMGICSRLEEIGEEVASGLGRIRDYRDKQSAGEDHSADIGQEIEALEQLFDRFETSIQKHDHKGNECAKPKSEINASKSPLLA
ncbi:hypothetical protein Tsubulata_018062 [Turnera subulata]|uniref:Uncharacterized protein n=1 Tax=Turnera subulata TaxID=218843 RepID=A0A9Q0F5W0_9ROSI|nr:hypothetical protein Tsubulata_018062 [Turnera subulata]